MTGDRATLPAPLERARLLDVDLSALPVHAYDLLVVGSGIAGITAALEGSSDRRVAIVTKARLDETNTWYAQGGIAGAVGEADSVELHLADTLVVGQGLCDEKVVREIVAEAPEALRELAAAGMPFDRGAGGEVALAREGGHSLPRVLHSGDKTGAAIQQTLTDALRESARVAIFQHRFLVDLVVEQGRCRGAVVLDGATGTLEVFRAPAVVLATGGAGQVFRVTTNPVIATGDGVAAAWRAGADVSDLEFVQFHPTALDHEAAPRFLVSEALRGEGAYLLDCEHERFMVGVHPLAELAPRDVVSREIERVMGRCGRANVWLDARHLGTDYLKGRFPTIWHACAEAGYDLGHDLVPVAPAAHYMIGGVRVDIDGRSSIPGLYASGEVAATGLHGANRLASNSLLEGLVISRRIVRSLRAGGRADEATDAADAVLGEAAAGAIPSGPAAGASASRAIAPKDLVEGLRRIASAHLGMSRTREGLAAAGEGLERLAAGATAGLDVGDLEAVNLLTVAALVQSAASMREESRGCHSRLDHPERDDEAWRGHLVWNRESGARYVPVEPAAAGPVAEDGLGLETKGRE